MLPFQACHSNVREDPELLYPHTICSLRSAVLETTCKTTMSNMGECKLCYYCLFAKQVREIRVFCRLIYVTAISLFFTICIVSDNLIHKLLTTRYRQQAITQHQDKSTRSDHGFLFYTRPFIYCLLWTTQFHHSNTLKPINSACI